MTTNPPLVLLPHNIRTQLISSLKPEDVTPEMFNLVYAGILTNQFAFNRSLTKESFMATVSVMWELGKEKNKSGQLTEDYLRTEAGHPLDRMQKSLECLILTRPNLTKEKVLTYLNLAWKKGEQERKISDGDIEEGGGGYAPVDLACTLVVANSELGLLPV